MTNPILIMAMAGAVADDLQTQNERLRAENARLRAELEALISRLEAATSTAPLTPIKD